MSDAQFDALQWHGDADDARRIIDFLDSIGIEVEIGPVVDSILPGMTVTHGAIRIDPTIRAWPGDLLHEAGHIAVTDAEARSAMSGVSDDAGAEMAAIAWSFAAATAIGIAPDVLFHEGGYRGGSRELANGFTSGRGIGAPLLAWWGMTAEPHRAPEQGIPAYPVMQRWLR